MIHISKIDFFVEGDARKFFGVILLAIAVNMFVNNILAIIARVPK